MRLVGGLSARKRASDSLKPFAAHLATNRQRRERHASLGAAPRAEKHRPASSLGGVGEPEASPLVSQNGRPLDRTG